MFHQPSPLCLGQRCLAQRVLTSKTASFEHRLERLQRSGPRLISSTLRKSARQGDDKTKTILKVSKLRFAYQPIMVQRPKCQYEPGEGLDETRLQIFPSESAEKNLARVLRLPIPGSQICQSWVPQCSKIAGQSFRSRLVARDVQFRRRQRGRSEIVDPHRTPSEFRGQAADAALKHRQVGLRHLEAPRSLYLTQAFGPPCGL